MDALAPGDPKLVSMIVNHLKNQGLFDQFRRDCLADVDTKPAYQNLRQRVDNFVSNHLASHTWSPHLNKNQLRNSLRQMVLQSGMLEVGVDRIISQVVDPKINHIFRPQVEKAVHEFLATVDQKEEPASMNVAQNSEKQEPATSGPSSCPSTSKANDALSILDTITSLNQEASASRITAENSLGKMCEKISKKISLTEFKSQAFDLGMEKDHATEETEKIALETTMEFGKLYPKSEGSINALTTLKDFDDKHEKAGPVVENLEDVNEKNDKIDKREKDVTKAEQLGLSKNERRGKRKDSESVRRGSGTLKQTAKENLKKEYFLEDSDFEGLSDITVSSVHTSDLSSFEEDDDEEEEGEVPDSDSTDEVEEQSSEEKDTNLETTKEEQKEVKAKPGRHPYVHKPFLYSKYYNDSDDEETVVQRRQSIAKEKAERLLRRQWNRERVEDKRKQLEIEKDQLSEEIQRNEENLQPLEKSINSTLSVETNSRKMMQPTSLISKVSKAALKEQKILEKKVALRRKRKGDLRTLSGEVALHHEDRKRKREQLEELKETQLRTELLFQNKEKAFASTLKDSKNAQAPDQPLRSVQILSELNGENNNHLKIDHESCRKQPRSNDLDMSGLEQSRVNKLDDFGLVEENLKDSSKHKGEMKQVKHGDGELMGSESSSWTCDIDINDDQKIGTTFDSVITNYHQVIQSSDSKTLLPSDSAELPILEHGQEIKSRDHTKIKEEKGKEKKYIAEGSWTKSREYTQENTKSYEKNKEKRNESECLRSKFKESVHDDVKSTEKCKEKRNDFENPCLKFKESINEDGKTREKKNESERGRTKSRENTLEDKGHEKSKDKKYMSERTRSLSEESLQDDMKGSEKGKEKRTESGNSRSKSREKMHDDTRSHEKLKENQNESGISRSKSRESVQEDVKNKDKRKNFENARSRSKEELQEDKREKRIEKRRESESSKSKERVDSSRSKTKESIELSRSKSKEDNEYKQKVVEKRHDSETARLKFKEHSEITRSKSREKLQGDVQYDEKVEKRRDSENVWLKSKDSVDGSRSKSKDKVQDTIQNEKGIEKKHSSENTGPKSRECSESSHLKVKEKMRDSAQGSMKGNDKRHDSKIKHFEKSHSKSKEDLQVNNAKKMEQRFDFGSNRSKSGERSEHSRSKSKEHSDSSRSKYKERVQENIQSNEKGMDKKHKYENTLSKSVEHSEISQLKSSEKGKESIKDCDKGKFKKSDFQNVQSKSKEFSESMQAKSKDKAQGGEKGSEKGNFETSQSCSKDKMPDLPCDEKLEEKDIKLLAALSKPKTDQEDEQSRDKSNKLKNVAEYVEEVEMTKSNEIQESHTVEYDQSGSKADLHTDIKNEELVEGKKDTVHFELKEWHLGENETNSTEKKSENAFSKSSEKFENDQSNNEGTDIENSQLHLEESRLDTKEIAHTYPGNMVQIENLIKSEDKLEERTETFESESSKAEPRENLNLGEKELETEQNETDGCKISLLVKEQTETPAHEQLAKSNEINIHPDLEQQGSLPIPYVAASPDDPTTKDSSLFHPIAAKAQFVYYDPSSPATPTLDENFSYEAPSSVADSSIPSVEGPGKQEAHSSENVAEELCAKNQAEEMDIKCEPPKVELQELPVQQDIVPEINTSAIGELKDEDLTEESVTGAREQSSTKNERKPKRSYTPVENPPKRRHLNSEEKSAAVDELVETIPVQAQEEESPMQCQEKTTKVEDKARNLTSDVSSQNKPTTRAAKKVSSPEHLSVTEQEKHSLTSTKEKPTTDVKSGKSPAPVSVTRSRNQPSPVIKQGRKREASPERKRRQHKTEVPPKRTRR